ncbi:OmpA family protein [Mesorhizobium sp. YR577]|uniref:OmpA family protein n=1 Tax=Mesorhizobium sp. YR577 TaxID=1884373 RepID=UPI0008E36E78|nr:OmpA family protein [Mesorhizobium sp. YR577]SFT85360.1 Outer membrane protein OmpA [Mesorhizobium sp. YR577]
MKRQSRILAGTALGILMASAPFSAFALQMDAGTQIDPRPQSTQIVQAPVILAQGEGQQSGEEPQVVPKKRKQAQEQQAPDEQAAPEQKQRPERAQKRQAEPEAAGGDQGSGDEPVRKVQRKQREVQEQAAEPESAPMQEEQPQRPKKLKRASEEAPMQAEQPASEPQAEQRVRPKKQKKAAEEAPVQAEQPAASEPQAEQPAKPKKLKKASEEAPAQAAEPTAKPQPQPAQSDNAPVKKAAEPEAEAPKKKAKTEAPASGEAAQPSGEAAAPSAEPQPAQPDGKPVQAKRPDKKGSGEPVEAQQPVAPGEPAPSGETQAEGVRPAPGKRPVVNDGSAAPVLDSQKQNPQAATGTDGQRPRKRPQGSSDQPQQDEPQQGEQTQGQARPRPAPVDAGPPPADDQAAQQDFQREDIQPVREEKGVRVKERKFDIAKRERPEGSQIVKQFGDRIILQFNNQTMVESNERPRMRHGARDVYYEDLPRGRTRETIERDDGTQVVTIRNSYGDVIRRSRVMPDGQEYVLTYVDEQNYDRVRDWRDPGDDLPPMQLDIPEDEYIMTSDQVEDPDAYYTFLDQPPVERVERLYSVDEVKRSARIRDKTRRIDLDTITFEFGADSIAESEVPRLDGVAKAMERILKANPAETFLIEGHTDAVGSDLANLALSDKRAEAVAEALTNVFGIPPENLTTQGYGEQYLKVNTEAPERQNRRVAIRRITPLVAPVASAN